jgi:isopenicillin-N epimerase
MSSFTMNTDRSAPDWAAARAAMMLDPTVINLNTGSYAPTPRPVFERVTELRRHLAAEPMDFILREMPPLLWRARERLAEFVGTSSQRLVFTANVSAAVNIVASGLKPNAPGEILMSDREYGAMQWCWERAAERQGLAIRFFQLPLMPASADEIIDAVDAALTPQTRLLFFSHVYSATGLIVPAAEICELARRRGIVTVVDGAHAPAMIPLAIDELGCDYYGGNCHKWLLAPIGSGFLVLGPNMLDRLEPLQVSWGFHPDKTKLDERDEFGSTPRTRLLEHEGTRDICPWLVMPETIDFQASLGWDAIHRRMRELSAHCRLRFADEHGLRLTTPADPVYHGAMTAYWWPAGLQAQTLRKQLWDRRIEAVIGEWPEGLSLRVSNHFYTTKNEIDELAALIPEMTRPVTP